MNKNDDDLADFIARHKPFADSPQSWSVATSDLSVKNPNDGEEVALRTPQDILDEIAVLEADSSGLGSEFVVRLPAPPNEPDFRRALTP